MKTTLPKINEVVRQWHLIDAAGKPAGRMAVELVKLLRGKHKRDFAPHVDCGDFVIVINAAKVKLTGNKELQKQYKSFSGYPDGLKHTSAAAMRATNPEEIVHHAVKGMMRRSHLGNHQRTRLKVYPGADHPHAAQNPVVREISI